MLGSGVIGGVSLGGTALLAAPVAGVPSHGLIVTVAAAKAHMRAAGVITGASDDGQLTWLITVAQDAIERDLGRWVVARETTETHTLTSARQQVILRRFPAAAVTSVVVDGTTVDPGDYRLSEAGILRCRSSWPVADWCELTVAYTGGEATAPTIVRKVALNLVQRMWQTSQQMPHPAMDDGGSTGGDFAAMATLAAIGQLTPTEYAAYQSLRVPGLA